MATRIVISVDLLIVTMCLVFCSVSVVHGANDINAICTIAKDSGIAPVYGTIKLSQKGDQVVLQINLKGFNKTTTTTEHGFHVHEYGKLTNQCMDAGLHYNPFNKTHGAPTDEERHVGDLGNVVVDTHGEVNATIRDSTVSLSGSNSIVNKSLVVHEFFDDLGRGNFSDSKTTGHAGRRFGCCVIQLDSASSWLPSSLALAAALTSVFILIC